MAKLPSVPQTIAESPDVCDTAEMIRNGMAINWAYWASRTNITPMQGARLAHCIDPIKWQDDVYAQGQMPNDLRNEIRALEEWLAERTESMPLVALVRFLGGRAPYRMREADASERTPQASPRVTTADDWREAARQIADDFYDRDTKNHCRDSLDGYSDRVCLEMQARKIHGPRGAIQNASTVKRDALQGAKWWAEKKK